MQDKPENFPQTQIDGAPLKSITETILNRRATPSFKSEEIPEEYLRAILEFGTQAPSGYNLQPWRFIVVRDSESKKKLQKAAFNQPKVGQAPVVLIVVGLKESWKDEATELFTKGAQRGAGDPEKIEESKEQAMQFLSQQPMDVWVTRHSMIALTHLMLIAEAFGYQTAPMEGFNAEEVKREFGIPEEGEVVSLLAIGKIDGEQKPFPGRFPLSKLVFNEYFGEHWPG